MFLREVSEVAHDVLDSEARFRGAGVSDVIDLPSFGNNGRSRVNVILWIFTPELPDVCLEEGLSVLHGDNIKV